MKTLQWLKDNLKHLNDTSHHYETLRVTGATPSQLSENGVKCKVKPVNNLSMLYFCEMMDCIQGTAWAEKVPKDLPIYNIGGDLDPVGNWGEGVYQTSNCLAATGHCVKTKLYSGYRHEIHNYDEIKNEVEQGIIDFFGGI